MTIAGAVKVPREPGSSSLVPVLASARAKPRSLELR